MAAAAGLSLTNAFRIRFCQYDNNPAPKDGFFIHEIEVSAELRPPILHLPMDDNLDTPTVIDVSASHQDQVFLDPAGDPNTQAHSVPGMVGTALAFDGVDDQIDLGTTVDATLTAGHDFAVAFWWARGDGNDEDHKRIFSKGADNGSLIAFSIFVSGLPRTQFDVFRSATPEDRLTLAVPSVGYDWNHYVFQRRGTTFEVWMNGTLVRDDTTAGNDRDFSGPAGFILGGLGSGYAKGTMDDFRVYDRSLVREEVEGLGGQ